MIQNLTILVLAIAAGALACSGNSADGKPRLGSMSRQERARQEAGEARYLEGERGRISNAALSDYVAEVGARVARHAPKSEVAYGFAVLDGEDVDAFALPGGYVYVTRGLLVLLNEEAELAAVLGHAISHAALRHPLPRVQSDRGLFDPKEAYSSGSLRLVPYVADQEVEADQLDQRMLAAAGFDPGALAGILRTLHRLREMSGAAASTAPFASLHEVPAGRIAAATRYAESLEVATSGSALPTRAEFVDRLDGVLVGGNPAGGIFRDEIFMQPDLAIWLRFPNGWSTENSAAYVAATAPDARFARVMLEFAGQGEDPIDSARAFATGPGAAFGLLPKPAQLGGNSGARAYGRSGQRTLDVSWLALGGNVFQISGVCGNEDYDHYQTPFIDVALSLRTLTQDERDSIMERRLSVARARAGETLAALIERTGGRWTEEETAIVNGLERGAVLREGQRIKVPIERRYEGPAAS